MFQHLIALTNWVLFWDKFFDTIIDHVYCIMQHSPIYIYTSPTTFAQMSRERNNNTTFSSPDHDNLSPGGRLQTPRSAQNCQLHLHIRFSLNPFQFVGVFVTEIVTTWVMGASNSGICTKTIRLITDWSIKTQNSIESHPLIPMLRMLRFDVCSLGYVLHCHKDDLILLKFDTIAHLRWDRVIGSRWLDFKVDFESAFQSFERRKISNRDYNAALVTN